MSVITISRGTMSGGKAIAEQLAEILGYRCVDRDVIVEKASAYGVSQDEIRDALMEAPSFLERFGHKKYIYLTLIQAALAEEVAGGEAVYHGNAGHLLLRGAGPVFRVRVIAPMEFRIKMARERLNLSRNDAVSHIQKMDDHRRKWTKYLYGVDWTEPSLYHLVINLETISIDDAVETIAHMVRQQKCFHFNSECQSMMLDLAVASRVRAALALNDETSHLELAVTAKEGRIKLLGKLTDANLVEEIERVASAVKGVNEVNLDEIVTPTQA